MYWFSGEYLLWWRRGASAPALVTTSETGADSDVAGALGEPGTSVLFGDGDLHTGSRNGTRWTGGLWLNRARSLGVEVRYTSLEVDSDEFFAGQADTDVIARPFFNTQLSAEDARLINFDGVAQGDVAIFSDTDFDTTEIMLLRCVGGQSGISNMLFGYRTMSLDETIRIEESSTSLMAPTMGTITNLFDQFAVENTFHGAQIGVHYVTQMYPNWTFDFQGKAGIGNTRSRVQIEGQTTTTVPDPNPLLPPLDTSTTSGGLLALGTNSGSSVDDDFGAVFEIGLNLHRDFRNGLQFKIGYTFVHWGNVLRAVEQIDPTINPTQIPPDTLAGTARPSLDFNRSSFWAQGLNLGLEYRF